MIITRTPFRISFFGGGTDYPVWYHQHGGAVLSAAVNKYCHLTIRYLPPFHEHRYRIVYRQIELCQHVSEIQHPAVRAALEHLGIDRGLEIHHDGDLPARSGMGTSSSFTVGLLHALYALSGKIVSKEQLAKESIHIEQEVLRENVGSQDQVAAAYGGLNCIYFAPNGEITVCPMTISHERMRELNDHLMLFYSGIKRTASDVAQTYVNNLHEKKPQLRIMRELMNEALAILSSGGDVKGFGELLHEAWQAKRGLSKKVSNPKVDEIYETARKAGAIGGKLTGAGGGGFMLLFAPPERHEAVRQALSSLIYVPIRFDFNGTQVIFFDPSEDFSALDQTRVKSSVAPFRENFDIEEKRDRHLGCLSDPD